MRAQFSQMGAEGRGLYTLETHVHWANVKSPSLCLLVRNSSIGNPRKQLNLNYLRGLLHRVRPE